MESLTCQSRRSRSYLRQHTEAALKLIYDITLSKSNAGLDRAAASSAENTAIPIVRKIRSCKLKPYEHLLHSEERVQADVKILPRVCIADLELCLSSILRSTNSPVCVFRQSACFSADFPKMQVKWYARHGVRVKCIQTDNRFEFTNRFSNIRRGLSTL